MRKTYVYVDGFNLYYGALKGTPYRWLDLVKFCRLMLPQNEILRINYYTALVGPRLGDLGQPIRQQTYLRALRTQALVQIHLGHYLSHVVRMPLANPMPTGPRYAEVIKTEEKGSDVNLAAHLVRDAFEDRFEAAVVITNDSDLLEPEGLRRRSVGRSSAS